MEMTDWEIRKAFCESDDKWKQIKILAELNMCSTKDICEIVKDAPVKDVPGFVARMYMGNKYYKQSDYIKARIKNVLKDTKGTSCEKQNLAIENFSKVLKAELGKRNLSLKDFCADNNLDMTTMYSYSSCRRLVPIYTLWKVADALDCSIDYLVGRVTDEVSNATMGA